MDALHDYSLSALLSKITLINVGVVFVAYVVFSTLYQIIHYRFFHPLAKFPGPFLASVTRIWIAYENFRGRESQTLLDLHRKYGACGIRSHTYNPLVHGDRWKLTFRNKDPFCGRRPRCWLSAMRPDCRISIIGRRTSQCTTSVAALD